MADSKMRNMEGVHVIFENTCLQFQRETCIVWIILNFQRTKLCAPVETLVFIVHTDQWGGWCGYTPPPPSQLLPVCLALITASWIFFTDISTPLLLNPHSFSFSPLLSALFYKLSGDTFSEAAWPLPWHTHTPLASCQTWCVTRMNINLVKTTSSHMMALLVTTPWPDTRAPPHMLPPHVCSWCTSTGVCVSVLTATLMHILYEAAVKLGHEGRHNTSCFKVGVSFFLQQSNACFQLPYFSLFFNFRTIFLSLRGLIIQPQGSIRGMSIKHEQIDRCACFH